VTVLAFLSTSHFVSSSGYLAIFVLCVAQSCCIPTSSEITMGFAGVLAATGHLSLEGAVAVGVSGELLGAYVAWLIGRTGGRAIIERWGKYVLLTKTDLDRAEAWYGRHERWGVFGGRLVPFIRGFVALVAGVAEVPVVAFGLLTAAGSLVWLSAMAGIGYGIGGHWHAIVHAFSDAGYVLAVVAVAVIAGFFWHRWKSYRTTRDLERQAEAVQGG
jgi:membrane protein DedA with SNARE-associated domain